MEKYIIDTFLTVLLFMMLLLFPEPRRERIYRNHPASSGSDTRLFLIGFLLVWIQSFLWRLIKAKEPSLPYYLAIVKGRADGFMPMSRTLRQVKCARPELEYRSTILSHTTKTVTQSAPQQSYLTLYYVSEGNSKSNTHYFVVFQ